MVVVYGRVGQPLLDFPGRSGSRFVRPGCRRCGLAAVSVAAPPACSRKTVRERAHGSLRDARTRGTRFSEITLEGRLPDRRHAATFDNLVDDSSAPTGKPGAGGRVRHNDHREAVWRSGGGLKELEGPYSWRSTALRARDLAAARDDADLKELVPRARGTAGADRGGAPAGDVPSDPADHKDVIVEIRQGEGGDEAALWLGIFTVCTRARRAPRYKLRSSRRAERRAAATRGVVRGQGDGA